MKHPTIKIELRDGTDTWITVSPVTQLDYLGAQHAAGLAFAMFMGNLGREHEAVDRHMKLFPYGPSADDQ